MTFLKKIEEQVRTWPDISVHAHRFGGSEFRLGNAEIGHVHTGGLVDIPFPKPVRDALLEKGLAQEHHWVPNSGWTTFHVRTEKDLAQALWLLRLSYLRYALRSTPDPRLLFEREAGALGLAPELRSLLEPFVNRAPNVLAESSSV